MDDIQKYILYITMSNVKYLSYDGLSYFKDKLDNTYVSFITGSNDGIITSEDYFKTTVFTKPMFNTHWISGMGDYGMLIIPTYNGNTQGYNFTTLFKFPNNNGAPQICHIEDRSKDGYTPVYSSWRTLAFEDHTHSSSAITGLAAVATSGSYNDLINKPTIDTHIAITNSEIDTIFANAGF